MTCPKCGANLPDGAAMCTNCGSALNQCPNCKNAVDVNAVMCPKCGAKLAPIPVAGVKKKKSHTALIIVAVVVGVIILGAIINSASKTPATSPEESSTPSSQSSTQESSKEDSAAVVDSSKEESSEESSSKTESSEGETNSEPYSITYNSARAYTNSIGTQYVQMVVEIENTSSADLYLSTGSCDIEDENGKLIASQSMVSVYPSVISPGEKGYMYDTTILDEPVSGNLVLAPRPDVKQAKVENVRYNVTDLELKEDSLGNLKAVGRVENTTEEDGSLVYIVVILKDAGNVPIGQLFTILTDDLAAGDKIGFEASTLSLPDDITKDSVASYEVFAYPYQLQF